MSRKFQLGDRVFVPIDEGIDLPVDYQGFTGTIVAIEHYDSDDPDDYWVKPDYDSGPTLLSWYHLEYQRTAAVSGEGEAVKVLALIILLVATVLTGSIVLFWLGKWYTVLAGGGLSAVVALLLVGLKVD